MYRTYEIVDHSKTKLGSYLQEFSSTLGLLVGMKPIFFDLVSVELKEGKNYEVVWFAPDINFSLKYREIIDNYFDKNNPLNASHKSLLFLEGDIRHEFLNTSEDFQDNCIEYKNTYRSVVILSDFTSDSKIPASEETLQKQFWIDGILKKIGVACASFSKVKFNISQQTFSAALWIGFPKSTGSFVKDSLFITEVEKILWYHSLDTIATEAQSNLKKQAIRAAISQVMARNMSHNIGSHVMNKLIDADTLRNFLNKPTNYYKSAINLKEQKIINDAFDLIAIYNNYVKCRMDYLADITFGTPVMQTNKLVFSEIFGDLDKNRLLLDNISGINKFSFEIEFQFNGGRLNRENDIRVAMPNDVLGCQALYNIIENVIRNTAKHNQNKQDCKFILNIDYCKDDYKMYQVEIFDTIPLNDTYTFKTNEEKEDYWSTVRRHNPKLTINETDSIPEIDFIVYRQNKAIDQNILTQDNNQLRNSALGMIEMEASAAYLRKMEITNIDSDEFSIEHNDGNLNSCNKLYILKAFNKNNCLGYKFIVNKPTEFLLIGDFGLEYVRKQELLKEGIWIKDEVEFIDNLTNGEVFNHQFILYQDEKCKEKLTQFNTSLPFREIFLDHEKDKNVRNSLAEKWFSFNHLENMIWEWRYITLLESMSLKNVDIGNSPYFSEKGVFNACFLDHAPEGDWSNLTSIFKDYESQQNFDEPYSHYLEALSSLAQSKLPNFNGDLKTYPQTLLNNPPAKCKLAEACLSKVLVIDERIQEAGKRKSESKVPFKEIYKRTGVILPEDIDLGDKNYTQELVSKIRDYIDEEIQCLNPLKDFILIHYSILQRMFNSDKSEVDKYLNKLSENQNVIVTSGRGKPELSKNIFYINLSPITNAFIDIKSKYLINQLLHSARK